MDIEVPAIGNANAILFDHLLRHHLTGPPDPSLTLPSPSLLSETFDTPTLLPAQSTSQSGDHQCRWTDCGESFGSSATLMAHVTETHVGSGKATYICEWEDCPRAIEGRVFSQRQKVLRHIQTHTGALASSLPYMATRLD